MHRDVISDGQPSANQLKWLLCGHKCKSVTESVGMAGEGNGVRMLSLAGQPFVATVLKKSVLSLPIAELLCQLSVKYDTEIVPSTVFNHDL